MYRIWTILIFLPCNISAQSLPSQWKISSDSKYLVAGNNSSTGLYDESKVEEIRLYFSQADYWAQLTQKCRS